MEKPKKGETFYGLVLSTKAVTSDLGFVHDDPFIVKLEVKEVTGGIIKGVIVDTLDHPSVNKGNVCKYDLDNVSWNRNKKELEEYLENNK